MILGMLMMIRQILQMIVGKNMNQAVGPMLTFPVSFLKCIKNFALESKVELRVVICRWLTHFRVPPDVLKCFDR